MTASMRRGVYTTKDRLEALAEATQKLTLDDYTPTKKLHPNKIKFRPALFQPREITYGLHELDDDYVNDLRGVLRKIGKLDPPVLVIKLKGVGFVCVDGHHSIAAYKAENYQEIECDWFKGTVPEAMDAGLARNAKIKLNLPNADRYEEAWKRTLMDHGSKSEVVAGCIVGDGTVAFMRKVKRHAIGRGEPQPTPDEVKLCREKLHIRANATADEALAILEIRSWSLVKRDWFQLGEGEEMTPDRKVANLVRRLKHKFQKRELSRDPAITARALMGYDFRLLEQLAREWETIRDNKARARANDEDDPYANDYVNPLAPRKADDGDRVDL